MVGGNVMSPFLRPCGSKRQSRATGAIVWLGIPIRRGAPYAMLLDPFRVEDLRYGILPF